MEYRAMDALGIKTSLLGFGCMRFPTDSNGEINEEQAQKMLDLAIASGVNYIDTAYPYHEGKSEPFVGRALKKYDRSSYCLATKLPCWFVNKPEDVTRLFEEQLSRLRTDYIDFYLLHALNKEHFDKMLSLGVIDICEKLKAEGKIKYLGFSFHDSYEQFERILTYRKWDFCQIQYNYMDTNEQAGDKGYALTEKLGIPLIIMEPVKGGSLSKLPQTILPAFTAIHPDKTPASWALRWVGTHPNVKVILSGMSDLEQTNDNLETFQNFVPLNDEEMKAVQFVADSMKSRVQNSCTACRYCMPCPAGVDIPKNFKIWNTYHIYENEENLDSQWNKEMPDSEKPDHCIKCGKCEQVCPQHISIREDLVRLNEEITSILS